MLRHIAGAALALAVLVAPAAAASKKIALVLPGPITDGTFNSAANKGIEAAKAKYDIEVVVRENTDFAQIEDVLRSYAEEGYDMVIGHGFQFAEPVMNIHAQYPNTFFVVNTAQVSAEPNVASFDNRWGDAGWMAGAVAALAGRSPIPVEAVVDVPHAPPPAIEGIAYFVISECLANAVKHSSASRVWVRVAEHDGRLYVKVIDDGVGGADLALGTGLIGLSERVASVDGTFEVSSPLAGPTQIQVELPCAS